MLTEATLDSLVYGSEAVLPIKVEIQSLRVLVETKVLEEDWAKEKYEQLALIHEKRARTQYHAQRCRHCILYPLQLRPPFPNDAQTLRPKASLEPN